MRGTSLTPVQTAIRRATCFTILLMWAPTALQGQGQSDTAQVRAFASAFYRWYVPIALADSREPSSNVVLRQRPQVLTPELLKALRADASAWATGRYEIALTLDADPFLNSQDPCDRYDIGTITRVGRAFQVEVIPICGGTRSPWRHGVVAEVVRNGDAWQFVNFREPEGKYDLLNVLETQAKERARFRPPSAPLPDESLELTGAFADGGRPRCSQPPRRDSPAAQLWR